jgi:hypothetical protein
VATDNQTLTVPKHNKLYSIKKSILNTDGDDKGILKWLVGRQFVGLKDGWNWLNIITKGGLLN